MNRYIVNLFKALGDSNRLRILKMLEERALCVCEVQEILQLSTSTVSKHLSILRDAGMISDTKDGKWVNYSLGDSSSALVRALKALVAESLNDEPVVKEDRRKAKQVDRAKICAT